MNISLQTIVEQFNRLDVKIRYGIFALFLLAIVALDYFFLIRFQLGGLAAVEKEIAAVYEDTSRVKKDIQRMGQIKQGLELTRSQLEALNTKVRSVLEVATILDDISKIANEFHVNIDQLTPLKEGQDVLASSPDAKYFSLPIVITAHSGYHMFGRFLNKLENGNLLFMVRDLTMEDSGKGSLLIQTTLKVVVVDRSPQPEEPKTGKKK